MKTTKFLPSPPSPFRGALNMRNIYLTILCLIIATLWNTHSVSSAPAKTDLQPPIFEASASASSPSSSHVNGKSDGTTIDSYGNPIESLQPIETPDGRKVVSAQGLQFEIPNYASGITELKKPADDLLPPFVGEFSIDFVKSTIDDVGHVNDDKPGIRIHSKDKVKAVNSLVFVNNLLTSDAAASGQHQNRLRFKRQLQLYTTDTNNNNNNNNYNDNTNTIAQDEVLNAQHNNINTDNNSNVANTTTTLNTTNLKQQQDRELNNNNNITTTRTPSSYVENSLSLFVAKQSTKNLNSLNSLNFKSFNHSHTSSSSSSPSPSSSPSLSSLASVMQSNSSFQSPSSKTKLSAHFTPISNGNFNYPNVPTDTSIIDRIVSKYKNPLPTLDPIVVALPNESSETYNAGPFSSTKKTSVHVENIPLVEVKSNFDSSPNSKAGLPDYILELNDPDIAGPVDYEPAEDNRGLKVIAWDLLPPFKAQEIEADKSISHSNKVSVNSGHNFNTQTSQASSHTTHWSQFGLRNSFESTTTTSTTPRITTTRRSTTTTTTTPKTTTTPRTTTTTTPRPTTTTTRRTTTTTRRTTTPLFTTPRTTTAEPDPSEFFKLEAGDSYTLPPWLQDIDDPELDVAVAYIVPEDINEYNQTIDRDILPPLEPYTDLKNVHLTQPPTTTPRTSTTRRITVPTTSRTTLTTTTTTKRPTVSTYQPHWIRAKVTTVKPTIATFNNQFTSFSPSISSFNSAQRTTSTTTTTTTTTVKPKTTTNYYNRGLSTTTSPTDKFGTSSEEVVTKQRNPFLPSFNDGKYRPQSTTRRTTTTTTTTPAPEIVEENPFEPTIPPYLRDFDYPDLGAGVPFVYDPNEDENPVDKNILPPSKTEDTITKSNSEPSSNSPFSNSQKPQGFTNKFSTSTISLASSSSIPSIVTIPLPSTQTNQADNTVTRPPPVFVPPPPTKADDIIIADNADDITKKTSSTFNKHFAAPFEPTTTAASSSLTTSATTALGADVKKVPLSADRESFPPFNNIITGSSTLPSKTTFTKSEDGKVITNNIFLSGSIGSTSAKPIGSSFGLSNPEKNTFSTQSFTGSSVTKSTTASSVFKQFGSTSSGVTGFVTTADSLNDGSKYTGRFGGPPGVLAPQNSGFTTSSTTVTKTYNKPAFTTFGITSSPGFATNNKDKFTGSFGGPPGILKPYDNVKNR